MNAQMLKIRHEAIRWHLIAALNVARPEGMYSQALLPIVQSVYPDCTELEIRRELDYLDERELVRISRDPMDRWMIELTRWGVDVAEYTVECDPGVTRPRFTQG